MVGVFLARDLIFFYICFEFTLVPMFFLIAIYGGSNRAVAHGEVLHLHLHRIADHSRRVSCTSRGSIRSDDGGNVVLRHSRP